MEAVGTNPDTEDNRPAILQSPEHDVREGVDREVRSKVEVGGQVTQRPGHLSLFLSGPSSNPEPS